MTKQVEQIFRKLTEIEHVLARPGRYIGEDKLKTENMYLIKDGTVIWRDVTYVPAFLKLFDEIISNSADFSKRIEGKHLNAIDVIIDRATGYISVFDNGGIPVVLHKEYKQYVPDMIFGELRSGSNFDDDDAESAAGTGQNGEGATLTNIYSKEFTVDTADGKNRFLCTYHDNMSHKDKPAVTASKKHYTKITYLPDYARLGIELDDDHYALLERRVYEIAATNSQLKVSLNGNALRFKSFKDFANLFSTERIDFGPPKFQVSVFHSKDGFQQVGFINSTNVFQGGTHVDYVMTQVVDAIREQVKKKTKQDVKPSDIRNHFFLMVNATVNNPRYNSQTKEKLTTLTKNYGVALTIDDKTTKAILKSNIVAEIIAWAENKQKLEELADLAAKNKELDKDKKKNSLRDILKYETANSSHRHKCILFIAEGDSAAKPLQGARNKEFHGIYPTKGKPLNVRDRKMSDLMENKELMEMMRIIGLKFGHDPSLTELRYNRLVIAADQDLDGFHLCGLHMNTFFELWPGLVKKGFLYKLQTPIVRVKQGKNELEFMSMREFDTWQAKQTKPFQSKYLKGLGSNDTIYLKKYMAQDQYMVPIVFKDEEDKIALDIAFSKDKDAADKRKVYIYGEDYAN